MRRAWPRGVRQDAPGYQRLAYLVGVVLLATGLVRAGIWAVVGGSSQGPLSWRKPTSPPSRPARMLSRWLTRLKLAMVDAVTRPRPDGWLVGSWRIRNFSLPANNRIPPHR